MNFLKNKKNTPPSLDLTQEQKSRIQLSNTISYLITLVAFPYIFFFRNYSETLANIIIVIILAFLTVPILNRLKKTISARYILIITTNLTAAYYASAFGKSTGIHYLFFAYLLLPIIIFEFHQKKHILLGTLLPTILLFLLEFSNYHLFTPIKTSLEFQNKIEKTAIFFVALIIIIGTHSLLKTLGNLYKNLHQSNIDLEKTNKNLSTTLSKLQATQLEAADLEYKASLSTLSTGIAHEIRNPMAAILGSAHYLASIMGGKSNPNTTEEQPIAWTYTLNADEFSCLYPEELSKAKALYDHLKKEALITENDHLSPTIDDLSLDNIDLTHFINPEKVKGLYYILKQLAYRRSFFEFLDILNTQIPRILEITDNMMHYGISGGGLKEEISIQKALQSATNLLTGECKKNKITLKVSIEKNLPLVLGNEHRLQQAFFNIMFNAIQAMQKDPNPNHRLEVSAIQTFFKTKGKDTSGIEIKFSDTGHGIPAELQQKIFDPFFTTKGPTGGKNIGLGLSILKEVITHHEGNLIVLSEEGKGTTFIIYLPQSKNSPI